MELGDSKSKRLVESDKQNSMFSGPPSRFGGEDGKLADPFCPHAGETREENPFSTRVVAAVAPSRYTGRWISEHLKLDRTIDVETS